MSKRFIEIDEFRKELKNLKRELMEYADLCSEDRNGTAERLENTIEAVNKNADAGMELSKRLDALQKRVESLQNTCKALRVDVDAKNSNGAAAAFLVGAAGFIAFIYLVAEINEVQKQIDILNKQKAKSAEKTFRESEKNSGNTNGIHSSDEVGNEGGRNVQES